MPNNQNHNDLNLSVSDIKVQPAPDQPFSCSDTTNDAASLIFDVTRKVTAATPVTTWNGLRFATTARYLHAPSRHRAILPPACARRRHHPRTPRYASPPRSVARRTHPTDRNTTPVPRQENRDLQHTTQRSPNYKHRGLPLTLDRGRRAKPTQHPTGCNNVVNQPERNGAYERHQKVRNLKAMIT